MLRLFRRVRDLEERVGHLQNCVDLLQRHNENLKRVLDAQRDLNDSLSARISLRRVPTNHGYEVGGNA